MARKNKVEVVLKATDKASPEIAKVESRFKRLGTSIKGNALAITAAIGSTLIALRGLARGITASIDASEEQEASVAGLTAALSSLGSEAETVSQSLQAQAAALQKTTTFGDEAIIKAQTLIAAFIKEEDQIKAATAATLDFSVAFGIDLNAAAQLVAKTLGSSTNALTRYGIEVEGAVGSSERLASAVENIGRVAGGRAAAEVDTFRGATAQLSNAWGDLLEVLGDGITQSESIRNALKSTTTFLSENASAIKQFIGSLGAFASGVAKFIEIETIVIRTFVKGVTAGVQLLQRQFDAVTISEEALRATSERLGISVEALERILKSTGREVGNVTAALEEQQVATEDTKAVTDELVVSTKDYDTALKELGITLEREVVARIDELDSVLVKLEQELRDGTISQDEFANASKRINTEMDNLVESFDEYGQELTEVNTLQKSAADSAETYTDSLQDQREQIDLVAVALEAANTGISDEIALRQRLTNALLNLTQARRAEDEFVRGSIAYRNAKAEAARRPGSQIGQRGTGPGRPGRFTGFEISGGTFTVPTTRV